VATRNQLTGYRSGYLTTLLQVGYREPVKLISTWISNHVTANEVSRTS